MDYLTADPHFGHANIIGYCDRLFENIDLMNAALISEWNLIVNDEDTVYLLGDLTLGRDAWCYTDHLNGVIKIVPGGHDKRWIRSGGFKTRERQGRITVLPSLITVKLGGEIVSLCHWAQRTWDRSHHGSLSFHGHSHGMLPAWPNALDVGVDNAYKLLDSYRPFLLEEAVAFARSY